MKSSIPNLLTSLRLAVSLVPLAFLAAAPSTAANAALAVLVVAMVTDFLDGYLARTWNVTSRLGQVLDSIADKLVLTSLLILALFHGMFGVAGTAIALLLLLREVWIGGLREGLGQQSSLLAASKTAKWKTALQFTGLAVVFADVAFRFGLGAVSEFALAPALVLSLVSAWHYSRQGLLALAQKEGMQ